jgi:hypothetical protein
MSHTLFGDLHLEAGKGADYWWPLIFEALGEGSFHLSPPGQPQGIVSYWHRQPNPPGRLQQVAVPFRTLWDEICGEVANPSIIFGCQVKMTSISMSPSTTNRGRWMSDMCG